MDNKSMISLSFDDGRLDNYTIAYPILKRYGLPATFNITTSYCLGLRDPKYLGTSEPAMNVDMVREIASNPCMEIAGHGDLHDYSRSDMTAWKDKLQEMTGKVGDSNSYTKDNSVGFAVPGTSIDINDQELINSLKDYGIAYTRVSLRYKSCPKLKTLIRKMSRVLTMPILYKLAYKDTLIDENDKGKFLLNSVPLLASVPFAQLKALIDEAIKKEKHMIIMLHSIKQDSNDNWVYPVVEFEKLCAYLKKKQEEQALSVVTTMELYNRVIKN